MLFSAISVAIAALFVNLLHACVRSNVAAGGIAITGVVLAAGLMQILGLLTWTPIPILVQFLNFAH